MQIIWCVSISVLTPDQRTEQSDPKFPDQFHQKLVPGFDRPEQVTILQPAMMREISPPDATLASGFKSSPGWQQYKTRSGQCLLSDVL